MSDLHHWASGEGGVKTSISELSEGFLYVLLFTPHYSCSSFVGLSDDDVFIVVELFRIIIYFFDKGIKTSIVIKEKKK